MENATPILSVKTSVNYGAIQALKGVDLDVYPGEIVAVIGANGAGKSTMMNAIMGDVPRAGRDPDRRTSAACKKFSGRYRECASLPREEKSSPRQFMKTFRWALSR